MMLFKNTVRFRYIFFITSVLFFSSVLNVFAERYKIDAAVESLVLQLKSLRNTDRKLDRLDRWTQLEKSILDLRNKKKLDPPSLATLVFNQAVLYEELGRRKGNDLYFNAAKREYQEIHKIYPNSALAEEAIYHSYQLCLKLNNIACQQQQINQLTALYPNSRFLYLIKGNKTKIPPQIKAAKRIAKNNDVNNRKKIIVLDPGHGGEDEGAVGIGGIREKDLTLAISLEVKKALLGIGNYEVVMTRKYDKFVPIIERSDLANQVNADLLLSIHVNASPSFTENRGGFEIYYVSDQANPEAIQLIDRENRGYSPKENEGIDQFILDIFKRGAELASKPFAEHFNRYLIKSFSQSKWRGVKSRGVKKGPFYLLMGSRSPAVLFEAFFVSDRSDINYLIQPEFRSFLGEALAQAIDSYFKMKKE